MAREITALAVDANGAPLVAMSDGTVLRWREERSVWEPLTPPPGTVAFQESDPDEIVAIPDAGEDL